MTTRKLSFLEGATLGTAMFSQLVGPGVAQADVTHEPVRDRPVIENVSVSPGAKVKGLALDVDKSLAAIKNGTYNAKIKAEVLGVPSHLNLFTTLDGQKDLGMSRAGYELSLNPRTGGISGPFKAGVVQTKTTLATDRSDPRMADAKPGEKLVEHAFQGVLGAGINFSVPVGGTPVSLGLRVNGEEQTTLIWTKLEKNPGIFSKFQIPLTVADAQAQIRPGEGYAKKGQQTVGLGGSVTFGYATSGVRIGAGASAYFPVTGNLVAALERDPKNPNLWTASVKQVDTASIDRAYTLNVGLDAGSLGVDGLVEKAAGALGKVAKAGLSLQLQDLDQDANLLKVTIDDRTPAGEIALAAVLIGDYSWAQRFSAYADSGVHLERSIDTNVAAHTKNLEISGFGLKFSDVSTLLERTDEIFTDKSFVTLQTIDRESAITYRIFDPVSLNRDIRFVDRQERAVELPKFTGDFAPSLPPPPKFGENSLAGHDSSLAVDVEIVSKRTGANELYRALGGVLRSLEALKADDRQGVIELQKAIAGGVRPEADQFLFVFGDQSFDQVKLKLGAKVAPEGFASFLAPNGTPRTKKDFERLYLNATGALRLPVSEVGVREAIARTLKASLQDRDGVIQVSRDGQVIGTLTPQELQVVQDALVARVDSDLALSLSVGKWKGTPPAPLVKIPEDRWGESEKVVDNARAFATAAMEVQALWLANQEPTPRQGEGAEAHQVRVAAWRQSSLYYQPEVYSAQLLEAVKAVLNADRSTFPAFALVSGTDPQYVQVEAKVDVKEKVVKKMLAAGADHVKQFAAARLLLEANASFNRKIDLLTLTMPPGMSFDQVKAAAEALFPESQVTSVQMTRIVQIKVEEFRSDEQHAALGSFLGVVKDQGGQLRIPDVFSDADARRFAQVAGPKAYFLKDQAGYRLVLDNHGHSYVQIREAAKAISTKSVPLMYPAEQEVGEMQRSAPEVQATFKAGYVGSKAVIGGREDLPVGNLRVNGQSVP